MAVKWTAKPICEDLLHVQVNRRLLPVFRHQFIPTAIKSTADSRNGSNQQIYFTGLDSPHTSRIYVSKFGQSLLSHVQGRANTADVAAEFAEISDGFNFGHILLRERSDIDLKGVLRPNRGVAKWEGKRLCEND